MQLVRFVVASSFFASALAVTSEGCPQQGDDERRAHVQNVVSGICKELCSEEDKAQDDFPECSKCPALLSPSKDKVMDWSDLMSQQVALSSAHLRSMPQRFRRRAAAADDAFDGTSTLVQPPDSQGAEDKIDDAMEEAGLAPRRKKVTTTTPKPAPQPLLATKKPIETRNGTTLREKNNATKVDATAPPNVTSVLHQASAKSVANSTNRVSPVLKVKPLPKALRASSPRSHPKDLPHRGYVSSYFPKKPSRLVHPDSDVQPFVPGIGSYPGRAEEAPDEEQEQTQREFLPARLPQQQRQQFAHRGYYSQASGDEWGDEQQLPQQLPQREQDPSYAAYFARRVQQAQVPNPSTLPAYEVPDFTDRVAGGRQQFRLNPHPSVLAPELENEEAQSPPQQVANPLDAGVEDLKKRVELQNKLAGMCVQRCKELGAYPMCTRCPTPLNPVPQALSWNALFASMDGMGSWGRQQLAGLDHISLFETSGDSKAVGCSAIDANLRFQMQSRLAGLCSDKCRKAGPASASCLQCRTLTSQKELSDLLAWGELMSRMQALAVP